MFLYTLSKNPLDAHSHEYAVHFLPIIVAKKEI